MNAPQIRPGAIPIWWGDDLKGATGKAYALAQTWFDLDGETFEALLSEVALEVRENASTFEVDLGDTALMDALLEQAKETLALRGLQQIHEACEWRSATRSLEQRTRELEEEARRDALTGLYNRAHLDCMLEEEFADACARDWPLAVVFIDLDHFKRINDSYGHHAGDAALRRSAGLLIESTREGDIVARYGGEEFVIVLPDTKEAGVRQICERILMRLRAFVHELPEGVRFTITASAGAAVHGEHQDYGDAQEMIRAADRALYRAKAQGRDRYAFHADGL